MGFNGKDQPCQTFVGHMEANKYALWENRHQCMKCRTKDGTTSFCENCHMDHHDGGYISCEHYGCPSGCAESWAKKLGDKE